MSEREKILLAALKEIASHPAQDYKMTDSFVSAEQSQYKIGVADGHRCAANIAKEAIAASERKS